MEKIIEIDSVEVVQNWLVQIRQRIRITENGSDVAQSLHRYVLTPGQDISDQPEHVQAICNAAWTPEIIAAYQAAIKAKE